jgi:hypothetical protein
VPTIHHRARVLMVGTLRFAPYEATRRELICLPCKLDLDAPVRQINTTCKSLLIIRNRVKPGNQKYCASVLTQISRTTPLVSRQMRGVGHRHERAVRCGGR